MSLQFCIGGSGSGKSERLYADVIRESLKETDTRFFIIVPDQFTMQTQKELVRRHPSGGIMNIDVLSFGRLTHRILEETGGGRQPVLDDTGKSLILRRIASDYEGRLTALGSHLKRVGYIHEVKSAISEFMQYGIGTDELKELTEYARPRGSLYYKLKDLGLLYEGFQEAIRGRFVTTEGRFGLLAEAIGRSEMIRDSIVVLDGFTGFTPIQNQVIRALLERAREVRVALIMDGAARLDEGGGEEELFSFSKKMMRSLIRLAQEAGAERKPDIVLADKPVPRFRENPGMAHLEQELFRCPSHAYCGRQESVYLTEASTPAEEVRQVCLEIRRLIRKEGYQYRDIAVIAGDLSAYADHIEELFARFSIPCYLDMAKGIRLNPFVEYLRSAWRILLQNFSYESVFHFLRSGLCDITQEETDRLENYVLRHNIRGKKAWSELFVRRSGRAREEQETQELEALNDTRRRLTEMLRPLSEGEKTAGAYVERLYRFTIENKCYEKLKRLEARFRAQGDLVRAEEYRQVYRLVMELFEQIYDLLGEEEMSLQEFSEILDAGFDEIQVGTIPQNVDRIVAGDMERTRLQEIRVLFFIGVNDGNIPRSGAKGGIISDIDREFLADGKWEMAPTPRQQMYIQRLYLYMNMTKPSERLYLSYARVAGDGKTLRPAYLIGAVKKLFPDLTVKAAQREDLKEQIEILEDGFDVLARQLREYAKGNPVSHPFFFTLYRSYAENDRYADRLRELVEAAFFRYRDVPLGKEIAHALYGNVLYGSVSRLEQYAACAYSYFLQYGLSLKERELFGFEAVDMGTLFHGVLERFSHLLEENGSDWFTFSPQLGEWLLEEAVEEQAAVYHDSILFDNARYLYAVTRMKRILRRAVFTLQSQLAKGRFSPAHFELSFETLTDLEAVNISLSGRERMRLQGRIDRIDTCKEGDTVYVKVIDYKSGDRTLDIAAVYYGLELQLVVYMNAAMELMREKEPQKTIVPAAMLYYHVADPLVRADEEMSEETLNAKLRESLRMSGIVNEREEVIRRLDGDFNGKSEIIPVERKKDGSYSAASATLGEEQLRTVSDYVNRKIHSLGRRILNGEITKAPYAYASGTGCDYCAYRSVCGFQERLAGYEKRRLPKLGREEALARMRQEGDGQDGDFLYGGTESGH